MRDVEGHPVEAMWLGYEGDPDTCFWQACIDDVVSCSALVAYVEPGDELHGGLIEIGAALGAGIPVHIVGNVPNALKTAHEHPSVTLWPHYNLSACLTEVAIYLEWAANTHDSNTATPPNGTSDPQTPESSAVPKHDLENEGSEK